MELQFITDEKLSETSSKGNQEKWYNKENNRWYKMIHSFSTTTVT